MTAGRCAKAEELVKQLEVLGCKSAVSGDRLAITPGGEPIPALLLMELRDHKSGVVELLKQRPAPPVCSINALNEKPSKIRRSR